MHGIATRPSNDRLTTLRRRAASCERCGLFKRATQTVFGEGDASAKVVFVGEEPGDVEDREGRPFVGPAGQLLREALEEAGFNMRDVYLTNAVKHFKWSERGKRRIHERPNREEVIACHMWLEKELTAIRPRVLVALGATAAAMLFGSGVKVTKDRGKPIASALAPFATVTVHPASILRAPDSAARAKARREFLADLTAIAARLRHKT